jgi:eukaryotic-like serine/threonine-protein kinase
MLSSVRWFVVACAVSVPAAAYPQASPVVMFRGDPAHTGVSSATPFAGQGGVRWRVQTGGQVRSSPAVTATRVYIGSGDGSLYAIDRATGRVIWRFAAGGTVDASPAVAGGLVVAATLSGRIFAVDERTGTLRWSMRTGAALPPNATQAGGWDMFASSPVVAGETVVIGGGDGGIYALDLRSGKQQWTYKTTGRVRATPAVKDGVVITGSWDGRVYALDLATGKERWVHRTAGDTLDSNKWGFDRRAIQSSAAIVDGAVYVGSRDGGFYMLDAATGTRHWRFTHRGSWVVGSPVVKAGRAYVGSSDGHFIQAVDVASGNELWRVNTVFNTNSSPTLLGDLLVIGLASTKASAGGVLAIDAGTGTVRWQLPLGANVWSSPVPGSDGELYVGTDAGEVVAIHEVSRQIPKLAVFYDSTATGERAMPGGAMARGYFADLGYEVLDKGSLATFLSARVSDGAPSAVVFATDILPASVAATAADTVLFRRYLAAGGKAVWIGEPVGAAAYDSTGQLVGFDIKKTEQLTGVSMATFDFDLNSAFPTAAGRQWGLTQWFPGHFPMAPSAVTQAFAVDSLGMTTAWVKSFRPDRPDAGFVQLWGMGATLERLPFIRMAAEYGLLRAVSAP